MGSSLSANRDAVARYIVRGALVATALCFLILAAWNEYGDKDPGGLVIHPYVAGVLGVAIAVVLWFAPSPSQPDKLSKLTRGLAIVWIIGAGTLDLVPDAIQGLQERILMVLIIVAVAVSAWRLMRLAPDRSAQPPPS
jgi:hypothetical protein